MNYMEVLKDFCSKEEMRPKMMTPFIQDNYVCATNGLIGIIIPKDRFDNFDGIQQEAGINLLELYDIDGEFFYLDLSTFPELKKEPIYQEEFTPCKTCNGEGECTCFECDNVHPCGKCDGEGQILVPGSKKVIGEEIPSNHLFRLDPKSCYCSCQLLSIIQRHFPKKLSVIYAEGKPLLLKDDEIKILLMPKRWNRGGIAYSLQLTKD